MLPLPGKVKRVVFPAAKELPVRLYQPTSAVQPNRIIVAVHGISREYHHQLSAYKQLSEEFGYWLLVPEFKKGVFSRYQQLAQGPDTLRADLSLNTILIAIKGLLHQSTMKIHLCGYSGGAQFAHRYALLYPQKIASLVLCSAGWYTFPDKETAFPGGTGKWPNRLGKLRLQEMLALPTLVMVGENDTGRDKSVRQTKVIDSQQGLNRVERADNWVYQMNKQKQLTSNAPISSYRLSNVGHDFWGSVNSSEMLNHIEHFWQKLGRTNVCTA